MQKQEKALRYFFRHFILYLAINAACLLIWLLSGLGYFWPIWPIVFGGIPLFVEAVKLKVLPGDCQQKAEKLFASFPKMTAEYEDNFVKNHETPTSSAKKSTTTSKTTSKKSSAAKSKTAPKKTATKKAATPKKASAAKKTTTKKKVATKTS